jgi:N-acetyl-anhydromuramyl-L-alanine amidase AmpD
MPNNGFEGDSDVADRVEPSLGFRRKKYDERPGDVVAIVVHTTGGGPVKRFKNAAERKKFKYKTPFDAALRIYRELMFEGPHYLVGQGDGEIAQLAPETLSAWHVGQAGGHLYDLDQWSTPDVRWWKDRWGTLESPRGLANGRLWSHDSVNANTIGIEVVPHEARPLGSWGDAAWANLVTLVQDVADRHGVPIDRAHIITHSDAHPLRRSASNKPWDPRPAQWTWDEFRARA